MSKGLSEGIWGAGEELKRILEENMASGYCMMTGNMTW